MSALPPSRSAHSRHPDAPFHVTARVHACIPDFELVYVRADDGCSYALTPMTEMVGVRLVDFREGQTVDCLISAGLSKVLSATLVGV